MVCPPHERLAIREAPARWAVQSRFVDDGRIEIESNIVKGAIRSIALNRKNALLAGSEGEGYNRVIIVSLIETCSLKIVAPKAHLSAALARIVADHLATKIGQFLRWLKKKTTTLSVAAQSCLQFRKD